MIKISRRKFIAGTGAVAASLCLCGMSGCSSVSKPGRTPALNKQFYSVKPGERVEIHTGGNPQLDQVGKSVKIIDSKLDDPLIIAVTAPNRYSCTSLKCTHGGVELEYLAVSQLYKCSGRKCARKERGPSVYALNGRLVRGPAKKPLKIYHTELTGDRLVISL